jgi:integrase
MARRSELKDKAVAALPAADPGKRLETPDTEVRGLLVRVTEKGTKSFALYTRFPGSTAPSRRALGEYPDLSLAEAREKARKWKKLIAAGIDPRDEEERQRLAEQQKRDTTFAAVAEDFISQKVSNERAGKAVERDIRKVLIPAWGKRPIADVTDVHVLAVVNAKKRTAPVQARNLLALVKRLFGWAVDQRVYGLGVSPCASLKPAKIIGDRSSRDRVLSDDEMFALWRAVGRMRYPHGSVYKLLVLTALRLNEAAQAAWSEFDPAVVRALRQRKEGRSIDWKKFTPDQLVWVIPKERMKARDNKARPHAVPLTPDILSLLESLPVFKRGNFLFSTSFGKTPAWIGDKVKAKLDRRMLRTLRALAHIRGDDASAVTLPNWVNHDVRRTVRSNLARLRVPEAAAEAVMAHVRPGVVGVYDRHAYIDEKRDALMLWAARLREITIPRPSNVVSLRAGA